MFGILKAKAIEEATASVNHDFERAQKNLTSQYGNDFLTTTRKKQLEVGTLTEAQAIEIMQKKVAKEIAKKTADIEAEFKAIEEAPDFISGTVETEWKRSSTWGANPTSTFNATDGYFTGTSVGGCGYDKGSTSVAEVLNQSMALKKALYTVKEAHIDEDNHKLFGYGSGYGLLPYFEGGVGVNCYPAIFEAIGFQFETVASGKSYDVYNITKK